MKILYTLSILILCSCEGHFRSIYLEDQVIIDKKNSINSIHFQIPSDQDVENIFHEIATQHGLTKVKNNQYSEKGFSMSFHQLNKHLWRINLVDWPSAVRSDLSKKIQKEIIIKTKLQNKD